MNSSYEIRKIRINEAFSLHKLFKDALSSDFDYFSENYLNEARKTNSLVRLTIATQRKDRLVIGVYDSTHLIGFSLLGIEPKGKSFLYWMYLLDKYRGKKLGGQLLTGSEKKLSEDSINSVSLLTHDRADFYKHYGYSLNERLSNHSTGVTMYLMTKELV